MLGVVPQAGDGVAVVVVHDRFALQGVPNGAGPGPVPTLCDEEVHLAAVECLLLVAVVVVLVARELAARIAGGAGRARVESLRGREFGLVVSRFVVCWRLGGSDGLVAGRSPSTAGVSGRH